MARLSTYFLFLVLVVCSTNGFSWSSGDPTHRLLQHVEALEAKLEDVEARWEYQQQASNAQINGLKAEVSSLRTGQPRSLSTDRQCCTLERMPTSCLDLDNIGHILAGFYTVKAAGGLQTIYCDFTKPINQIGFQKTVGLNDVKTSPVYFFAMRDNVTVPVNDKVLNFTSLPLTVNIGDALNISSGIFTAPVAGKYFFSFTGLAKATAPNAEFVVYMLQGSTRFATGYCNQNTFMSNAGSYCTPKVQATVNLRRGDTISLKTRYIDSYLHDNSTHYTQYTGWLIDEDVSPLLAEGEEKDLCLPVDI